MIPPGAAPRYRSEIIYLAAQLTFVAWTIGMLMNGGPAIHALPLLGVLLAVVAAQPTDRRLRARTSSAGRRTTERAPRCRA